MTPVDAFSNLDRIKYNVRPTKETAKLKVGDYVRSNDKSNLFSKGCTSE